MYEDEAETIRTMMRARARIIYSKHADRERMPEREITDRDVRTVLETCLEITQIRENDQGPVWSVEGHDLDGRRLRICVAVKARRNIVIVVTTIELK
ncbi:DUF4258 domain-containing protein [Azospirillum doebereinerae]|uniref:DUF4258 domain-containing protein n=1 Tax=Azospirillum doebereinerae TaxID=92933 RepID=A0A433JDT6_9PROT|nr:DUF4258 domain-containing protein [Azospirillum doebereinerae]RUQ75062.1 DUF4258 domain-containing protein [Azospirillum doebereinerae]